MNAARPKRSSPILGAASTMIEQAAENLVTKASRFHHSFEAEVAAIEPDPVQSRKVFAEEDIRSLAATMQERGQLQPILLRRDGQSRRKWIIVAGERRWLAAKLNGWETILAIEHDGDPEVASLLENLQRIDLTSVEEARGLQRLIGEKRWSQDQAAAALGKSKGEISATLRILTLPEDLLSAVLTSELPIPKHALVELARVDDTAARDRLIRLAKRNELTVRKIRSVRTAADGGADAPGHNSAEVRFNFGRLGKITHQLRLARQSGHRLIDRDRALLEALRHEIDEVLAAGGDTSV